MDRIRMYGAEWCGDCRRAKRVLARTDTDYEWIDVETDPQAAAEAERISGRKNIPVIVLPSGEILVEPTDPELERAVAAGPA